MSPPRTGRAIRVLHCPAAVGGHPQGLARAERELGLESRSVVFTADGYGYEVDEVLFEGLGSPIRCELRRWSFLLHVLRSYDVVHFNFGQTIAPAYVPRSATEYFAREPSALGRVHRAYARALELRDLPLLRRAGKGIAVTFQGGDARQGDFSRANFAITYATEVPAGHDSDELDARKRRRIARFDRYAHRLYALNPDLLRVLPARAEFLPYASVDIAEWRPVVGPAAGVPVVVHAPTDPAVKGTRFVRAAVERLRQEGVPFEYVQVEGMSRAEARAAYERADLLVDQLLAGWYGGVAVELMALGKPVVCYLRREDLERVPPELRAGLPIIEATPESVYDVLREWLTVRRAELPEVGRRSRAFVERWHDPRAIAARLRRDYEAMLA